MEEWKSYRLTELCSLIGGGTPKTTEPSYWNGAIPWLSVKDFGNRGKFVYSTEKTITEKGLNNCSTKLLQKGDIIISARGTVGAMAMIPYPMAFNQSCFGIRANKIIDPDFLYYLTKTKITELRLNSHGSVFDTITRDTFEKIVCSIPPLHIQKKIANTFSALDNKIELNNRINHNLEEQAQALFKSWFIDFEPFKEEIFVDSELGKIPEGWDVKTLGEVTKEIRDKVGARTDVRVLTPITTGQLVLSEVFFTKQVFSESIAKYLVVHTNDFAYNPARVNIGSLGKNEFDFDGCVSPVYVVFRCESEYDHFFNLYRSTKSFKDEVISRSNGGVRQTLGYKDFALIKLAYPPLNVVREFNSIYRHMLWGITQCVKENIVLAKQRDELLPKLMSGEMNFNKTTC